MLLVIEKTNQRTVILLITESRKENYIQNILTFGISLRTGVIFRFIRRRTVCIG